MNLESIKSQILALNDNDEVLGTVDGFTIKKVDGDKVKIDYEPDFVEAGNGYRWDFIPKNEIWLDEDLEPHEYRFNCLHELVEVHLMEQGKSYENAHEKANEIEISWRKQYQKMKITKRIYKVNPDCDLQRLHNIARVNNARIAAGEETTVTLGHTSSEDPELITIPVGTADNFIVKGDELWCDLNIDPEWDEQIRKYNKVSCELWVDDVITPVALLAKNRPALEVGVIQYQMPIRENINHKTYMLDKEVEDMSPAEVEQLFTETLNHSEFYTKFCDLLENVIPKLQESVKHMEETLAPLLAEEAEEPEHADIKEELEEGEKELDTGEVKPEEVPEVVSEKPEENPPEVEEKPVVDKNDMTTASANNTYIPDLEKKKKYQAEQGELIKEYQEKLLKSEQEKLELTNKLGAEKDELVKKYQLEARKNELNELSKTYHFDPLDEIGIVSKMDDAQWTMHKKIIVTKYQRSPVNRTVSVVTDPEERNIKTPDKVQKAIKLAIEKEIDFKTALDQV